MQVTKAIAALLGLTAAADPSITKEATETYANFCTSGTKVYFNNSHGHCQLRKAAVCQTARNSYYKYQSRSHCANLGGSRVAKNYRFCSRYTKSYRL